MRSLMVVCEGGGDTLHYECTAHHVDLHSNVALMAPARRRGSHWRAWLPQPSIVRGMGAIKAMAKMVL